MNSKCLVCHRPLSTKMLPTVGYLGYGVVCPRCGTYEVTCTTANELNLEVADRARLAGFLRHRAVRGDAVPILCDPTAVGKPRGIVIDDAIASVPRRVGAISDAFLVALSRLAGTPGGQVTLGEDFSPLVYSLNPQDLWWHVSQLNGRGLLTSGVGDGLHGLTLAGWERVEDLQRGGTQDPHQAFVAMWFDATMDGAYEDAIDPAIRAAGFNPYRIKDVDHNNKICDEILAEIRRSRFVVAEFTGNRGGVYFEAGFAMGLGVPVVWVVKDTDLGDVHFDTNHFNHVTWSSVDELKTKLQRRIQATIARPEQP